MTKAQELADALDAHGIASDEIAISAAALLREQDALLRQALDALDIAFAYEGDVFGVHHNGVTDTFAAIQEHLK